MKDIRERLLATFQVEHKEHLKCIRDILEKSDGSLPQTDLDEIFRRVHSLKGAARAVDLRPVENLAHRLETLFSRMRSGSMAFDIGIAEVVHRALDSSEDFLVALSRNQTPVPPTPALDAIEKLLAMQPVSQVETSPDSTGDPDPVPVPVPTPGPVPVVAPSFQPIETVRMMVGKLDRLVSSAGQLVTENLRQDLLSQKLRDMDGQVREAIAEQARSRKASGRVFRQVDDDEELASVSRYIQGLEHQTRLISAGIRTSLQLHERNSWALRSLTSELQTEVRQARMMPAEHVFEGFPKMVRDLARDEGKTVELQMAGTEVEADRVVLQALKDPLMHLLRNALSHGIESAEVRKQKGRKDPARIRLNIEADGNRLNITVEDNGCGLDLARISEVAVRQGLISPAEARARPPEEMARFVFQPGFSTSRSVTQVSGRGMGLSVVADAVSRLQGRVEIQPREGGGTRIFFSVPLSISSHRLLLVSCRNQTFAIPFQGIERLHRIPLEALETVEGKPVVRHNGKHVSLVSLASLLSAPEAAVSANQETLNVAILKLGHKRLAVAVDAFLSDREAVIKELPRIAAVNPKLAGGVLLEDGSVCLVLNSAEVVGGFRQSRDSLVIKPPVKEIAEKSSRILIVDDSLTTRMLEKHILEAHGYDVAVAVDGLEAMSCLQSGPVGLVVTDVEMPRMDGFTLLAEMKNDPRLARIPVIIVTSLENREHQERGLALGADAYVVKRRFEQQELLDTIQQIL